MIAPEDWREYQWHVESGAGVGALGANHLRHWRITLWPDPAGATLTFTTTGEVLTVPAMAAPPPLVLEPGGMGFGPIAFTGALLIVLETIVRA